MSGPLFVIRTVSGAAVDPQGTNPNAKEDGWAVIVGVTPVPLRASVDGRPAQSGTVVCIVTVPMSENGWSADGVNPTTGAAKPPALIVTGVDWVNSLWPFWSFTVTSTLPVFAKENWVVTVRPTATLPKPTPPVERLRIAPCAVRWSAMMCGLSPAAVVVTVRLSLNASGVVEVEVGIAFGVTVMSAKEAAGTVPVAGVTP